MPFHALALQPGAWPDMVKELRERAAGADPALVLYFASADLERDRVAADVAEAFPNACTMGCSSRREFSNAGFTQGGLAAMLFDYDVLPEVTATLVEDIPVETAAKVESACARLSDEVDDDRALWRPDTYVGLILADGLAGVEEDVMERLGDLSSVDFVGGSSSDNMTYDRTWVAVNGKARPATAALALLRPGCPWAVGKTQSWQAWDGERIVPTRVEPKMRRVLEFDHMPAIDRYATVLGYSRETLDFAYCQQHHPVGLVADGELFVRHPRQVNDDGSIDFHCRLNMGQPLNVLTSTPLLRDTEDRLGQFRESLGGRLTAVVDFCCSQRYDALRDSRSLDAYAALAADTPRVGFSTYGEQLIGHINCTSTMIVFGESDTTRANRKSEARASRESGT